MEVWSGCGEDEVLAHLVGICAVTMENGVRFLKQLRVGKQCAKKQN